MKTASGPRRLLRAAGVASALERRLAADTTVPILVLRLPEFAELAWREGKRAAQRLERLTAAAFRNAAERMVRDEDVLAHEPGSDWFIVALLARGRDGSFSSALDARAALERIAAAVSMATGRRMQIGWWPVNSPGEAHDLPATIELALERGARERERYEFLATVGHELRTPLTSIRGYIETLLDDDVDDATARRFLETAQREALRLGRLVDGMLEFSLLDLSPRTVRVGATDVGEQVESAVNALEPIARARGIVVQQHVERAARAHRTGSMYACAAEFGRERNQVWTRRRHGRRVIERSGSVSRYHRR